MSNEFLNHGKKKVKIKDTCKKGNHEFYVSKWYTRGSSKKAIEFYCKYCLMTMDVAEKDHQAVQSLGTQESL